MSIFYRFITNISWNILGKTGMMITSLGLSVLITRYLGKERLGVYATLLVIPAVIRLLNSFGLETVINKKIPELNIADPDLKQSRYLIKRVFFIRLLTTLFFSAFLYFGLPFYLDLIHMAELIKYRTVLIFYFALTSVNSLFSTLLMTLLRFKSTSIVELASCLLNLILLVIFIYWDTSIWGVLVAYIISTGFNLMIYIGLSSKNFIGDTHKPNLKDAPSLAWFSYGVTFFSFGLLTQTDLFLMNIFEVGMAKVGFYQLAITVGIMLTYVLTGIGPLALSLFAETYTNNSTKGFSESWNLIITFTIFFSLPIYIFVFFNATELLTFVYGSEYSEAGIGLTIYLVFLNLDVLVGGSFSGDALFILKKNKVVLQSTIEASFLNVALNIFLIPLYGELGAIAGTGLSLIYIAARRLWVLYNFIPLLSVFYSAAKYFLFCLVPLTLSHIVAWSTGINVLISFFCYFIFFAIFLFLLKPLSVDQARYISSQFSVLEFWLRFISKSRTNH